MMIIPDWTMFWATCCLCPCLQQELDRMISKGPFQPQRFSDPVFLLLWLIVINYDYMCWLIIIKEAYANI